jgi:hypothetical protein
MNKPVNFKAGKPTNSHPWKRASFVAAEAAKSAKEGKRDEDMWRQQVVGVRDRMGVRCGR